VRLGTRDFRRWENADMLVDTPTGLWLNVTTAIFKTFGFRYTCMKIILLSTIVSHDFLKNKSS
jgi:hypothetical protein